MAKRPIEAVDTVDSAMGLLDRLQREGWAVKGLTWDVDMKNRLPVKSTVTIELVPVKP